MCGTNSPTFSLLSQVKHNFKSYISFGFICNFTSNKNRYNFILYLTSNSSQVFLTDICMMKILWFALTEHNANLSKIIINKTKLSTGICCNKQFHEPLHLCAQGFYFFYLFVYCVLWRSCVSWILKRLMALWPTDRVTSRTTELLCVWDLIGGKLIIILW